MNILRPIAFLCLASVPVVAAGQSLAISPAKNRQALLSRLDAVVASLAPPARPGFAALKDPFHPDARDLREAPKESAPVATAAQTDQEVLAAIVGRLHPTGSVVLGGEPILLFGERRQKIGDKLTQTHDGVEYVVEIVNIENNQFRIRYKNEELTRPVK